MVVDFFTPWCNACRRLFPAICKVAENNPDVLFLKVRLWIFFVDLLCKLHSLADGRDAACLLLALVGPLLGLLAHPAHNRSKFSCQAPRKSAFCTKIVITRALKMGVQTWKGGGRRGGAQKVLDGHTNLQSSIEANLGALQVNGGDSALGKFVESLSVDKLPYFHFYHDGSLQAHFAANLTKINLLRAEICALKECKEPSCVLPEF